jgi:hypothetical protein
MELNSLTPEARARIAVHLKRFMTAMNQQRAFDDKVAASLERLARNPAFRQRINQMLSTKKDTSDAEHCRE